MLPQHTQLLTLFFALLLASQARLQAVVASPPEVVSLIVSLSRVAQVEYEAESFQEANTSESSVPASVLGRVTWGHFIIDRTSYRLSGRNVNHRVPESGKIELFDDFRYDGSHCFYLNGDKGIKILNDEPPLVAVGVDVRVAFGDLLATSLTMKKFATLETLVSEVPWTFESENCELKMKSNWPGSAFNEVSFYLSKDNGYLPSRIVRTVNDGANRVQNWEMTVTKFFRLPTGEHVPEEFVQSHQGSELRLRVKLDPRSIVVSDRVMNSKFEFSNSKEWFSEKSDRRTSTIVRKNDALRSSRSEEEAARISDLVHKTTDHWLFPKILACLFVSLLILLLIKRRLAVVSVFSMTVSTTMFGCGHRADHFDEVDVNNTIKFSIENGHVYTLKAELPAVEQREFGIVKTTKEFIEIKEVTSSCGCTEAAVKKTILGPSEKTTVVLDLTPPELVDGPKHVSVRFSIVKGQETIERTIEFLTELEADWRPLSPTIVFESQVGTVCRAKLACLHSGGVINIINTPVVLVEKMRSGFEDTFEFESPVTRIGEETIGYLLLGSPDMKPSRLKIPLVQRGLKCLEWERKVFEVKGSSETLARTEIPPGVELVDIVGPNFLNLKYAFDFESPRRLSVVMSLKDNLSGIGKVTLMLKRDDVQFAENLVVVGKE